MSLIHEKSIELMKSELDLFAVPPTQTNVEFGQWVEHRSLTTLTESPHIEFFISGSGDDYIDLNNTSLYIKARITKKNGDNLEANQEVAPVNNWMHSLFDRVSLQLNDKEISSSNYTYPYRAYIENLVSYGSGAKETQLTSVMWFKDTAGHMEARTNDNTGFETRQTMTAESKIVDMMGKLHLDLCFQERYLLNGVDIKLKLNRAKDIFSLIGDADNYKIVVSDAALFVRKVRLNSTVRLSHIKALEKGTAKYPISRNVTKSFHVTRGTMNVSKENLFTGQLPKRIIVGLVDNDAFNGIITKNPFNFKHYDINRLVLYMDGQQIPHKPLQPNFQRERYIRSYIGLFSSSGKLFHDEGNQISRKDFGQGFTLFGFDLTSDLSETNDFNLIKHGELRLEISFSNATAATLNCIVYGEFENIIEIDRNRNVIFDFTTT